MIDDNVTAEILAHLNRLPGLDYDALIEVSDYAAGSLTTYTLWEQLPPEQQGVRGADATPVRRQRAHAARRLWLATFEAKARRARADYLGA
jgi:hypothetical protein